MKNKLAACKATIGMSHGQSNTGNSFLRLPAELRNTIYELVLPDRLGEVVFISSEDHILRPPILRVCRQMQREAAEMWYSQAIFVARLTNKPLALAWIKSLPADAMALLRHVHLTALWECHCYNESTNFGRRGVRATHDFCIYRHGTSGPGCGLHFVEDEITDGRVSVPTECPTALEIWERANVAYQGLGHDTEGVSIEKEDLMALAKILDDGQSGMPKLCTGRRAMLRARWRESWVRRSVRRWGRFLGLRRS